MEIEFSYFLYLDFNMFIYRVICDIFCFIYYDCYLFNFVDSLYELKIKYFYNIGNESL